MFLHKFFKNFVELGFTVNISVHFCLMSLLAHWMPDTAWVIWEEMQKVLTVYSASQNKEKVYVHAGCILKIEGTTGV